MTEELINQINNMNTTDNTSQHTVADADVHVSTTDAIELTPSTQSHTTVTVDNRDTASARTEVKVTSLESNTQSGSTNGRANGSTNGATELAIIHEEAPGQHGDTENKDQVIPTSPAVPAPTPVSDDEVFNPPPLLSSAEDIKKYAQMLTVDIDITRKDVNMMLDTIRKILNGHTLDLSMLPDIVLQLMKIADGLKHLHGMSKKKLIIASLLEIVEESPISDIAKDILVRAICYIMPPIIDNYYKLDVKEIAIKTKSFFNKLCCCK